MFYHMRRVVPLKFDSRGEGEEASRIGGMGFSLKAM